MRSEEIVRRRMHNQRLWGPAMDSPEDVVGWLAAMQSQEFALAEWAVARRARSVKKAAIDRAVANGTILRSHVMRPTWHFVLPADIRWLLELTRPRINALNAFIYRRFGLDDEVFAKTNAVISRVKSSRLSSPVRASPRADCTSRSFSCEQRWMPSSAAVRQRAGSRPTLGWRTGCRRPRA